MPQAVAAVVTWVVEISVTTWIAVISITTSAASTLYALKAAKGRVPNTSDQTSRQRIQRSPNAPHEWVYGKTMKSGVLVYYDESDSTPVSNSNDRAYAHVVIALAPHECESFGTVYFNDKPISEYDTDFFDIEYFLGDSAQVASPMLVAAIPRWTNNHILTGICYIHVRFKFDPEKFPTGIPNVKVEFEGRNGILDPRTMVGDDPLTMTASYTNNAALCVMDYLLHPEGAGASFDELDLDSFIAAANICDEDVTTVDAGTEKRFTVNGVLSTKATVAANLKSLLSAMGGKLGNSLNGYTLIAPVAQPVPDISLTKDDLTSALKFRARAPRYSLFNSVKGQFVDALSEYLPQDFPPIVNSTYVAEDNDEEIFQDIDLPFTTSPYAAQRLARLALARNRNGMVVDTTIKGTGLQLMIGQTCYMTIDDMGWIDQEFEVINWKYDAKNGVSISLQETDNSIYTYMDDPNTTYIPPPRTTLPLVTDVPSASNLITTSSFNTSPTGKVEPVIDCTWGASDLAFVLNYEIQWSIAGANIWQSRTTSELRFGITGVVEDASYDVQVRALTDYSRSPWITATHAVGLKTDALEAVTALSASTSTLITELNWTYDGTAAPDLKSFELWVSDTNDRSLAVIGATPSPEARLTKYTDGNEGTRYFWIRALDVSGNYSAWFPSSSIAGIQGDSLPIVYSDVDGSPSGTGINYWNSRYSSDVQTDVPDSPTANATFEVYTAGVLNGRSPNLMRIIATGPDAYTYLGNSSVDYNTRILPNTKWIISGVVRHGGGVANALGALFIKTSSGFNYQYIFNTGPVAGDWVRVSGIIDLSADSSDKAIFRIDNDSGSGTMYFDDLMIEPAIGNNTEPSPYSKPAVTSGVDFADGATVGADETNASSTLINAELAEQIGSSTNQLFSNPEFKILDTIGRPTGVYAHYSNSDLSTIKWNETEQALEISSVGDTAIGGCITAIPVNPGTKYLIKFKVKSDVATASGFYFRVSELDTELQDGNFALAGDNPFELGLELNTRSVNFSGFNNAAITTSYVEFEVTYTPTPTAKWFNPYFLNWLDMGSNKLLVKYLRVYDAATFGATWGDNIDGSNLPADNAQVNAPNASVKINFQSFLSVNNGEMYLHGFDSAGNAANVDGYVSYNGAKLTIPKVIIPTGVANFKGYLVFDTALSTPFTIDGTPRNIALARKTSSGWEYDNNGGITSFTPTDAMIAIGDCVTGVADLILRANIWANGMDLEVLPEPDATVGATWDGNLSGQPSDAALLNSEIGYVNLCPASYTWERSINGVDFQTTGDNIAIADIGLKVGDVVSASIEVKSDNAQSLACRVRFFDAGLTFLSSETASETSIAAIYNRVYILNETILANTAYIDVGFKNVDYLSGSGTSNQHGTRAHLYKGSVEVPYSPPFDIGATVGATWGGDITSQPLDSELLNISQNWNDVLSLPANLAALGGGENITDVTDYNNTLIANSEITPASGGQYIIDPNFERTNIDGLSKWWLGGVGRSIDTATLGKPCLKLEAISQSMGSSNLDGSAALADYNFIHAPLGSRLYCKVRFFVTADFNGISRLELLGQTADKVYTTSRTMLNMQNFTKGAWHTEYGFVDIIDTSTVYNNSRFLISSSATTGYVLIDSVEVSNSPLGFVGDLNATVGATWGTDLSGRPVELTDGRVGGTIKNSGQLEPSISIDQGNGELRLASWGIEPLYVTDGNYHTFDIPYTTPPFIEFYGGLVFTDDVTMNGAYARDFSALNLTTAGFTPQLLLREIATGTTMWTDNIIINPGVTQDFEIEKTQAADAYDDKYTFQYDVTITNNEAILEGGSVTVEVWTNDGTGWTLSATKTHIGEFDEPTTTFLNRTIVVTVDGLDNPSGAEFGLTIGGTSFGGSIVFHNVKYTTATAPDDVTATPAGVSPVIAKAQGGL